MWVPPSDEGGGTRQRDGGRDTQRWFSRLGIGVRVASARVVILERSEESRAQAKSV